MFKYIYIHTHRVHLLILASWALLFSRPSDCFLFQRLKARYCWRRHRWQVELARDPSAFDSSVFSKVDTHLPTGKPFPNGYWSSVTRRWTILIHFIPHTHGSIYQWSRWFGDVNRIWQDASTAESARATALGQIPGRYARDVSTWRDADLDTFASFLQFMPEHVAVHLWSGIMNLCWCAPFFGHIWVSLPVSHLHSTWFQRTCCDLQQTLEAWLRESRAGREWHISPSENIARNCNVLLRAKEQPDPPAELEAWDHRHGGYNCCRFVWLQHEPQLELVWSHQPRFWSHSMWFYVLVLHCKWPHCCFI